MPSVVAVFNYATRAVTASRRSHASVRSRTSFNVCHHRHRRWSLISSSTLFFSYVYRSFRNVGPHWRKVKRTRDDRVSLVTALLWFYSDFVSLPLTKLPVILPRIYLPAVTITLSGNQVIRTYAQDPRKRVRVQCGYVRMHVRVRFDASYVDICVCVCECVVCMSSRGETRVSIQDGWTQRRVLFICIVLLFFFFSF